MMNDGHCPDAPTLRRFLLGKSSATEAVPLEQHLQDCDTCLAVLQTLPKDDSMVDALQSGSSKPEATGPEGAQLLAAWLKKLRPHFHSRLARSLGGAAPAPATDATESYGTAGEGDDTPDPAFLDPCRNLNELDRLGPYQIRKIVGAGGMGTVFEAFDPDLDRLVALKTMQPALAAQASAKQRFLREAKAAARIKHDHIVTIYQVGEDRGVCFLAMEYLQGESLERRLTREPIPPLADTLRIVRECAEGLAAAHAQGLIHRDIKPANIWLETRDERRRTCDEQQRTRDGNEGDADSLARHPSSLAPRVKILDFGLALPSADNAHLTQSGAIVGTPAYMAPEQLRGQPIDSRADLFSLGCVLYRLATGQAPFRGVHAVSTLIAVATTTPVPPQELNPRLPTALCDLITRLLDKAPEGRVDSALAVVKAIRAIEQKATTANLSSSSSTSSESALSMGTVTQRTTSITRRQMLLKFLSVAAALVAAGVLAVSASWSWMNRGKTGEPPAPAARGEITKLAPALPAVVELRKFQAENSPFTALVLSRDGSRALSGHRGSGQVILWDVATGAVLKRMNNGHPEVVTVAFGPDETWAVTGGNDKFVRLWNLKTGEERSKFNLSTNVAKLVMFRDGKRMLVGSNVRAARLRVLALNPYQTTTLAAGPEKFGMLAVALSPDEKSALAGGASGLIGLWNVETGTFVRSFKPGHTNGIRSLAFTPDGTGAVSASADGTCRIWDVASGEEKQVFARHGDPVQRAVFFPDGRHVISVGADNFARIWDSRTGKEIHSITAHGMGRALALSTDGRLLLTGSSDSGSSADGVEFRIRAWRLPPMPTDTPGGAE
jgi:serine/threonine protein kinase